jgi:hypothetical protein
LVRVIARRKKKLIQGLQFYKNYLKMNKLCSIMF